MLAMEEATQAFAALGSESRLTVMLELIKAGSPGMNFSELQTTTGVPASTLSHHIRFLTAANLVVQEKQGRNTISRPNFAYLEDLSSYLLCNCCVNAMHTHMKDGKHSHE